MNLQSYARPLISSSVDGPTLATAAALTALPAAAKYTVPANFWNVGDQLLIRATGQISSLITTPGTARFDVRMGGTVVFDSLAILLDTVAAHSGVGWILDLMLTCRQIGTAAAFWGQGVWTCEDILGVPATAPKGVLSAILPWNTTPALGGTFDSTVSQQLDLFFTQVVATGSFTLRQFSAVALQ